MKKTKYTLTLLFISFLFTTSVFAITLNNTEISNIKQQIINDSISSYSGRCPCPYNTMKNGRLCGKSSAYSKPGGKSPICYSRDITTKMVNTYKK